MNQKPIINQVIKGLLETGSETVKQGVSEAGKIGEKVISAKELLGLASVSDEEYAQKRREEERERENELAKLRAEEGREPSRNLEEEIKVIRNEKEEEERRKEEEFLEKLKADRAEEAREREAMEDETTNPHKAKKKRGSALAKGGKGKASTSDMSATGEFKGKVD